MSVQSEFLSFHDRIKLDYDVRSELADKRDILLKKLRDSEKLPSFDELNQGSYAMHLGTEPLSGKEYDIDVGLRINVNKNDYDPLEFKNIICEILKNHTEYGAEIKKPCVTVTYKKNGEKAYHVDLVVYTYEDSTDKNSQLYLARGKKENSDENYWEKSDPKGLIDYIRDSVGEENREQFRRVVRYLKRWKNIRFNNTGHAEPASIGITLIAANSFSPSKDNDLEALKNLVEKILDTFEVVPEEGKPMYRIVCPMPESLRFEKGSNAFSKMTIIQMTDFKEKLDKLYRDLSDIEKEPDEMEQCKKLNKIFGDDFHVPGITDVSKHQHNYIPASSASGVN